MSQANVKRAILQASCLNKYHFLKNSSLLNQHEKNALEQTVKLVSATSTEEEFTLMDKYLSDLMLIAKIRHESDSDYSDTLKRLTARMVDHTDAMMLLARRIGDH